MSPPKFSNEKPQQENGHKIPEAPAQKVKTDMTPPDDARAMKVPSSKVMQ
jgi:hypothetical protein